MPTLAALSRGILGGLFAEAITWIGLRRELHKGLPDWSGSGWYWFVTGVSVLLGGGLVVVYVESGVGLNPIVAVNMGATAPLVLSKAFQQVPPIEPGRVD